MFLRIAAVLTTVNFVLSHAYGQRRTMDYSYGWGTDHISWDSSTITKEELTQWMQLSPVLSHENGFLVPEDLALCISGDSRYQNCARQDINARRFELRNAQVNIDIIASRLSKLKPENYPPELSPVIYYFTAIQTFALQRGRHELEYFKTGSIGVLEQRLDAVNPAVSCKAEIGRIRDASGRDASGKDERVKLVRFDWENCLWFAARDKIGPYPQDAWKNFLAAKGITETNEEESPD
jgi:hypothetical protein